MTEVKIFYQRNIRLFIFFSFSPQNGVKTFTKTKTSSYTKTSHHNSYGSNGNSPFSSYSVKTKTGPVFEGGMWN